MGVLMFILNLIVFIIVLGVIILIHEFGHYIVAKKCGVLVYEFAFGMGPLIVGKKKGETLYSLRAIPLGGYCALGGEDINEALIKKEQEIGLKLNEDNKAYEIILYDKVENEEEVGIVRGKVVDFDLLGDNLFIKLAITNSNQGEETVEETSEVSYEILRNAEYVDRQRNIFKKTVTKKLQIVPKDRSFESKPKWQRFLCLIAGVTLNFLLALFIFLLLNFVDVNRYKPSDENIVGSAYYQAGEVLLSGDEIISVNGYLVSSWGDISKWKQSESLFDYTKVNIEYVRDGITYQATIRTVISLYCAGIYNISEEGVIYNDEAIVGQSADIAKDLLPGDKIVKINDTVIYSAPLQGWNDIIKYFLNHKDGGKVMFTIERVVDEEVEIHEIYVNTYSEKLLNGQGISLFDVSMGIRPNQEFDFGYAVAGGFKEFGKNAVIIFTTLGQLFTGTVKITQLSGPIGIFQVVGSAMKGGILNILFLIGLLSVNVGIMNLLPIPALDGGRVLFLGIEAISKKKINKKVESIVNNVFYFALLAFMGLIIILDILKLF